MRLVLVYNLVWVGQPGQAPKLHRESPAEVQLTRALNAWEADLADGSTQTRIALLLGESVATAAAAGTVVGLSGTICFCLSVTLARVLLKGAGTVTAGALYVLDRRLADGNTGELHASSVADRHSTCASSCVSAGLHAYILLALHALRE